MTTLVVQDLDMDPRCGACGANPATGFAFVSAGEKMVRLCHPEDPRGRDCYSDHCRKRITSRWAATVTLS